MVADDGPDHNVKFFDRGKLAGTFGAKGGLFSGVPGQWQPGKFFDLSGVGADREGRHSCCHERQAFRAKGRRRHRKLHPRRKAALGGVQSRVHRSRAGGSGQRDRRVHDHETLRDGLWQSGRPRVVVPRPHARPGPISRRCPAAHLGELRVAIRRIEGKRFLFFSDMYSSFLAVYRFDGEIAVPCADHEIALAAAAADVVGEGRRRRLDLGPGEPGRRGPWPPRQPKQGESIWVDANGDGQMDAGQYESNHGLNAPDDAWGWSVNQRGGIWLATAKAGVRHYACQGLNKHGVPRYDFAHTTLAPMPAPFTLLRRAEYDAAGDTMILSGYTAAFPNASNLWGKCIGRVVARYDHWSAGASKPAWLIEDLLYAQGGFHHDRFLTALDVAGDYVFLQTSHCDEQFHENTQTCFVYSKAGGKLVGHMRPGPEVQIGPAQIDIAWGMRAFRRADGEYLVFVEDDWFGKVLMYRWRPAR